MLPHVYDIYIINFLMWILKYMLCPNETPGFYIFCVWNALSLVYIGDESGRKDMKATGSCKLVFNQSKTLGGKYEDEHEKCFCVI